MISLETRCAVCLRGVDFDRDGKRFTGVPGLVVCGDHCAQTVVNWVNFPLSERVIEAKSGLEELRRMKKSLRDRWDAVEASLVELDTQLVQLEAEAENIADKFCPQEGRSKPTPAKGGVQ